MAGNFFVDGILHITDIEGYDHMLFLLAMCAPFSLAQWKPVLWLVTAFTLGHSLSLALAALDVIRFSSDVIEFFIPVTILLTAAFNLTGRGKISNLSLNRYVTALVFGVVHGMGFSSFFRMISKEGEGFIGQLFLFNLGVEAGQILIVSAILAITALLSVALSTMKGKTGSFFSITAMILSLMLAIEKWPF
jgi:hypothetical protein